MESREYEEYKEIHPKSRRSDVEHAVHHIVKGTDAISSLVRCWYAYTMIAQTGAQMHYLPEKINLL